MEDPQLESILKHLDAVRAKLAEPSEDARIEGLFKAIDEIRGAHARVWWFGDGTWCADCFLDGKNTLLVSSHCNHSTLESALTELLTKLRERAEPKKEPEPDPVRKHFDAGGIVRWGNKGAFYRKAPGKGKTVQGWLLTSQEWRDILTWGSERITADTCIIPPDSEIPELAKLGDCQRALLGGKWVTIPGSRYVIRACGHCRHLESSRDDVEWGCSEAWTFGQITDDKFVIVEPDEETPND